MALASKPTPLGERRSDGKAPPERGFFQLEGRVALDEPPCKTGLARHAPASKFSVTRPEGDSEQCPPRRPCARTLTAIIKARWICEQAH